MKRALAAIAVLSFVATACSHGRERAAPRVHRVSVSLASPSSTIPHQSGVAMHGSRSLPMVALTFDTNMTGSMLEELDAGEVQSFVNEAAIDELRTLDVPATIFISGKWAERYPEVTRSLADDPLFELASHSYAHRAFKAPCYGLGEAMPVDEMAADVEHSEEILRQFTAQPTPYFRFPGGCYDEAALDAVAPTGVVFVQYDVPSGDAFGTSVDAIVSETLRQTTNGSIVVMHLTGGNVAPLTAEALPGVVDGLRSRGLRLVKLSELLAGT